MEKKVPAAGGSVGGSYQIAYEKACRELAARDAEAVARRCGAVLNGRLLILSFFGKRVSVQLSETTDGVGFDPPELPLAEKILILHYLSSESSQPARGEMVSFKKLPGASFYDPTYRKRGVERIARRFGYDPQAFRRACRSLGWTEAELGDVSYAFEVFPRIRGVVVLHLGDEEFPPEANLLFNDDIVSFLPLEDVAVLAGLIAGRLARAV